MAGMMSTTAHKVISPAAVTQPKPARGLLQRQCACGSAAGPTGECVGCRRGHGLGGTLQAKLRVGRPDDPFEREADRVAEQVMRMPAVDEQRWLDVEEKEGERLVRANPLVHLRARTGQEGEGSVAPPSVSKALRSSSSPLDTTTRRVMEARFGHDLSAVRVHTDARAEHATGDINARAFTTGRDIVFGKNE
jgi:hypothetical protein